MSNVPGKRNRRRFKAAEPRWVIKKKLRNQQEHEASHLEVYRVALRAYLESIGKLIKMANELARRMIQSYSANTNADKVRIIKLFIQSGRKIVNRGKRGKA